MHFGKYLLTWLTIHSLCILNICNISYFPCWFLGQDLGSDCSNCILITYSDQDFIIRNCAHALSFNFFIAFKGTKTFVFVQSRIPGYFQRSPFSDKLARIISETKYFVG